MGPSTYDIRFFRVIFDLPTNPSPILSDSELPTQYMISDFDQPQGAQTNLNKNQLAKEKTLQTSKHTPQGPQITKN